MKSHDEGFYCGGARITNILDWHLIESNVLIQRVPAQLPKAFNFKWINDNQLSFQEIVIMFDGRLINNHLKWSVANVMKVNDTVCHVHDESILIYPGKIYHVSKQVEKAAKDYKNLGRITNVQYTCKELGWYNARHVNNGFYEQEPDNMIVYAYRKADCQSSYPVFGNYDELEPTKPIRWAMFYTQFATWMGIPKAEQLDSDMPCEILADWLQDYADSKAGMNDVRYDEMQHCAKVFRNAMNFNNDRLEFNRLAKEEKYVK